MEKKLFYLPLERRKKFNPIVALWCRIFGHKFAPIEMTEETHKVLYAHGSFGDLYECVRCRGRTTLEWDADQINKEPLFRNHYFWWMKDKEAFK